MNPRSTQNKAFTGLSPKSRRGDPRYRIGIPTVLMANESDVITVAKIADMSAAGAKLILPSDVEVPTNFVMAIASKAGPRRNCEVVWRTGNALGVRFRNI